MRTFVLFLSLSIIFITTAGAAGPKKDRYYYEKTGQVVWEIPTEEKVVALTFDDGPHPQHTVQILDLLKQYEAKATFFVVGNKIKAAPELLRREVDEGHEIANHTYSHAYMGIRTDMRKEINDTEQLIVAITGKRSTLFRPPGGIYNDNLVTMVNQEGYKMVLWSWPLDTKDWDTPGVNKIVDRVLKNADNGSIVLFHDYIEGPTQTIDALKVILPELQKRDYRFITVSELLSHRKSSEALHNR
ncbi:polysaccharide deacetylase family protein [Paenibacillus sp. GD4]|uniref:polysaccharide deacetylase family protein n=1 Tax=Paenibacillus sp. GD4 TaxID=3068890 RepID=UPI002796AFC4|nr:polysaccharide deacetylase family protein [Paenibacillus sp. GD4]MDQ1913381.1 polysaccharide deacetylase family protein [Paenibacillus sp. GD4]